MTQPLFTHFPSIHEASGSHSHLLRLWTILDTQGFSFLETLAISIFVYLPHLVTDAPNLP